ncbi:MAG: hypothetical protein E3J72_19930 [Planctomycetota bacterium]|nr:MAG: hypothetical protein E3J72_19930 [Planctomycetota bacterium]
MNRKNSTVETVVADCRTRCWRSDFIRLTAVTFIAMLIAGAATIVALLIFRPAALMLPPGSEGWNLKLYAFSIIAFAMVAVVSALIGACGAFLLGRSNTALAKAFDDVFGLSDHVSSAMELRGADRPFAEAVCNRADILATGKDPCEVFPVRVPRTLWLAVPGFIFLVLLPFLAGQRIMPPDLSYRATSEVGKHLGDFARGLNQSAESEQQKKLIKNLEELAKELEHKKMTRRDALAKIAKAISQLKAKAKTLKPTGINLERAAEELARAKEMEKAARLMKQSRVKAAAKEISKTAEGIKGRRLLSRNQDFEKMTEAFNKARRHLGRLKRRAKEVSKATSNYDRDKTARELDKFARELSEAAEQVSMEDLIDKSMGELSDLERSLGEMSDEELARLGEKGEKGEKIGEFFKEGSGRGG